MNYFPLITNDKTLVFFLILSSFLFCGILRAFYWKHTRLMLIAPFQFRYASQYLRQDNVFTERVNWISFVILFINFSLIFILSKHQFFFDKIYFTVFLLLSFYLLKFMIIKFIGKLIFADEISRLTVFYSFLSDKAFAICITPLILILYFFSFTLDIYILFLILFVSICFLLFKLYWLWKVGINYFGLSAVYIFLYLCILEIYPFVFFTKGFFY